MNKQNKTPKKFMKFDGEKARLSLIDPSFINGIGGILTFGAKKYAADNWKALPPEEIYRYKDALFRHFMAYLDGELVDPESGKLHLDHMSCNIMFLRYMDKQALKEKEQK